MATPRSVRLGDVSTQGETKFWDVLIDVGGPEEELFLRVFELGNGDRHLYAIGTGVGGPDGGRITFELGGKPPVGPPRGG